MKTFILLLILSLLLIWVGGIVGGQSGATIAFIFALIMNFFSYWYSDKFVLAMYRAKEVSRNEFPEIYEIVEELTERANLPMPKICIVQSNMANAFATGRNPSHAAVCLTTGILNILNKDELRGVIGHELGHIKNRDTLIQTISATVAMAIMFLATMARWAAIFGGFGGRDRERGSNVIGLLLAAILAPIAAMMIQMAISRTREYFADRKGAVFSKNPLALASALGKLEEHAKYSKTNIQPATSHLFIVNPLRGKGLVNLFSTHPPITARIQRLKEMAKEI
jgi:heat shock protein HtpX